MIGRNRRQNIFFTKNRREKKTQNHSWQQISWSKTPERRDFVRIMVHVLHNIRLKENTLKITTYFVDILEISLSCCKKIQQSNRRAASAGFALATLEWNKAAHQCRSRWWCVCTKKSSSREGSSLLRWLWLDDTEGSLSHLSIVLFKVLPLLKARWERRWHLW